MRRISIKRKHSSYNSLKMVDIYVEDTEGGQVEIGGVPCRKVCSLKSGGERTFDVTSEKTQIFAVVEGMDLSVVTEGYLLPEGTESLILSGKCKEGFTKNGGFCFGDTEGERGEKKKSFLKLFIFLFAAFIVFVILVALFGQNLGFYIKGASKTPRDFYCQNMVITLTDGFYPDTSQKINDAVFFSSKVIVNVDKKAFSDEPGLEDMTRIEVAERILELNGNTTSTPRSKDGLCYFHYEGEGPRETRLYYGFIYKTDDAFWFVQMSCAEDDFEKYKDDFFLYAQSVKFR